MNKRCLLLSFSLITISLCFNTSCSPSETVKHHFSNKWSYDQTYHFFRCLDEGCDEVTEKQTHFITDHVCEVCGYDDRWDNLNGGGEGEEISEISSVSKDDYIIDDYYSFADIEIDYNSAEIIDLSQLVDGTSSSNYTYSNNLLKIKNSGIYELTGTLHGAVEVSDTTDDVILVLNNADISTLESQVCAAIVFSKPKTDTIAKRYINLKEGSINNLKDSTGDDATNGDGAVIQAKKRDLVVNGKGTLNLTGLGAEASGIKAKTNLVVKDSTINVISAVKSGLKADEKVALFDANIKVNTEGDGIKTDMEPEDETEALLYSSSLSYGYIYIENTSIEIVSGDDGICANNGLYIANNANNLIKITTNGGAPTTITEKSSDAASGKGLKVDGIETSTMFYKSTFENEYGLVILGGRFEINSNDDAISSKGNLIIYDGTINISTGDDAIHAEYLTKIRGGTISINKCYEGIEGAYVEIYGGTINLISVDDGINAANGDLRNVSFYLYIAGGNIHVQAEGDGVDSNGNIQINGGNIIIDGPTKNDNGALDSEKGIVVNGGTLCAIGSKGMVETPSTNSNQYYINLGLSATATSGSEIILKNSSGEVIFSHTSAKTFQSVVFSSPDLTLGEKYTIIAGSETFSFEISSKATIIGNTNSSQPGRPGPR